VFTLPALTRAINFCGYASAGHPLFRVLIIKLRALEGVGAALTK
jgi:hypothetical protein